MPHYRNPDTGRFITREAWEMMQQETFSEYEDYEDYDQWEGFDEEEMY